MHSQGAPIMHVVNLDHIYLCEKTGVVRDRHIEFLYDDFYNGRVDAVTMANMVTYNNMLLGGDPPNWDTFDDLEEAYDWASQYGLVGMDAVSEFKDDLPDYAEDKKYFANIRPPAEVLDEIIGPVFADTEPHAVVLCVVAYLRRLFLMDYEERILKGKPDKLN